MKTFFRRGLLITFVATLFSGCAYFAENPPLQPEAQGKLVNDDVPAPMEFALNRSTSWRHNRSAYRKLHLVYERHEYLGQDQVAEFVEEVFPKAGWEVAFKYGLETQKYVLYKDDEECRVEVAEDFGDRFTTIVIDVEPRVTPRGKTVARRAD
ncbi:MAG: hypothetical protein KDD82_04585 [Planctomycetes bacterium]|nr:hypothetical protein [Planctomycetota bacterium]